MWNCADLRYLSKKVDKNGHAEIAILAIILRRRRRRRRRQYSRIAKRFYLNLDDDGRRKRDRRIPRIA